MRSLKTFDEFLKENENVNEARAFGIRELRIKSITLLRELGIKVPTEKQIMDFVDNLKTVIRDEKLGVIMENHTPNQIVPSPTVGSKICISGKSAEIIGITSNGGRLLFIAQMEGGKQIKGYYEKKTNTYMIDEFEGSVGPSSSPLSLMLTTQIGSPTITY